MDWTISRKGEMAYLCGVMMGDGFFGKSQGTDEYKYVQLKTIDLDFVEKFRDTVEKIVGKKYSIYKNAEILGGKKNPLHICRCYSKELVKEVVLLTRDRTEIPNFVIDGNLAHKTNFIQGAMDSEGYVTLTLGSIKPTNIGLWFANTANWTKDLWFLLQSIGVEVSKLYLRKMKDGRKNVHYFKIDILNYIDVGLGFNIRRKTDRLEFIAQILRDYMHRYKHDYHVTVQDIVRPLMKVKG